MEQISISGEICALLKTTSAIKEQEILRHIHNQLDNGSQANNDKINDNNEPVQFNGAGTIAPYADTDITSVIHDSEDLNKFVCYIFERRYGWSEAGKDGGRRVRKISSTGATLDSSDGQLKAVINDLLDNFIRW